MEAVALLLLVLSLFAAPASSSESCPPDSCRAGFQPEIRFPFRLRGRSALRCGYPGFDLSCDSQNRTILRLPQSGDFVVEHIDYSGQALFINDLNSCLPSRILNFSLHESPYQGLYTRNYTFFNCSSDYRNFTATNFPPVRCLSGRNHTVLAVSPRSLVAPDIPQNCRPFTTVPVPVQWTVSQMYWSPVDLKEDLELTWRQPSCGECVSQGGECRFLHDTGNEVGCFRPAGRTALPRGVMYGIVVGVGIPALICIIGLTCYACGIIRAMSFGRRVDSALPISSSESVFRSTAGLDRPTIESYPITVLGRSCRLPEKSDGTCPICLADYQPKEALRSIPECNHHFHVECIDEWLKVNGTCPVCRNSPEDAASTPFSPMSVLMPASISSSPSTASGGVPDAR